VCELCDVTIQMPWCLTVNACPQVVTLSAEGMVHSGGSKVISVGRNGQWDEELADGERRGLLGQRGAQDAANNDFSAGEESEEEDIDDLICPLSEYRVQFRPKTGFLPFAFFES
jgi:hypothetical protein